MRVPDEGKLPVSWLAGNQGEYATSTEVNHTETYVTLNVKTFFCEDRDRFSIDLYSWFTPRHCGP